MAENPSSSDIEKILGTGAHRRSPWGRRLVVLAVIVALMGGGAFWWRRDHKQTVQYVTQPAKRGDLTVTVQATGSLQPVNEVEVGTEISGTVKVVDADYNQRVKAGQVLAELDTDQLQAQVRQSEAALQLARAQVAQAQATLTETRRQLQRARDLLKRGYNSQDQIDTSEAAYARAQAQIQIANAQVAQAESQLDSNRTALSKAVIHSPIDGVILERKVEPGQTVAAALQTPVLFVIAENLAQMELQVAVDEADVGQVKEGQEATFTVDAYPKHVFHATITQVRYAPETVDGVVTYQTILSVDNSEGLLRPGMTATADIQVAHVKDALLVPNAALRFTPPAVVAQEANSGQTMAGDRGATAIPSHDRVWIRRDDKPVALKVTPGLSDGRDTAVTSSQIQPGMALLVDTATAKPKAGAH